MDLLINTAGGLTVVVSLIDKGKTIATKTAESPFGSQVVLSFAASLFAETGYTPASLNGITVILDGTSYTGMRVGAAIGNALAYGLRIPANGMKPPGALALPSYEK